MKITVTEEMREALRMRREAQEKGIAEKEDRAERIRWWRRADSHARTLARLVAQAVEEREKAPAYDPHAPGYWVTVHMGTGRLHCERCGEMATVKLPCFVQDFRVYLAGFVRDHRDCKKAEKEAGDA